jgi:hypothetical protein
MASQMTNVFWIAANIIIELGTGKTTDVLMLVNRVDDATVFETLNEAETYLNFVQNRMPRIKWVIESPTSQRPHGYLLRGVQTAAGR